MRFKFATGTTKHDAISVSVRNDESTLPIFKGAPVFLNGDNGYHVISAVNLSAAAQSMFFGIALDDIAVGYHGEAQVFGYFAEARIRLASRAASTDVWASYAAGAVGDALTPGTGTGTVAASVSADQCFLNGGSAALTLGHKVRLAETYASATTQASSIGGASTASITTKKAFVVCM